MIFFNDRKQLDEKYKEWIKTNKEVKDCSFTVISFLVDLLDEDKVKEFLK